MQEFLQRFQAVLRHGNEGISLASIRPSRAVYMLAYAFELMLYGVQETFLTVRTSFLGLPGSLILYAAHMLASLVVILLWSDRFRHLIRVSVAVMAAGFLGLVLLPEGGLRLVFGVAAMAGLGGAVSCARCGFAFAVNNTERMVGILSMTVAVGGVYLLDAFGIRGPLVTVALPLVLLAALSYCLLRFREGELEAKETSDRSDSKGLYCALAFMIGYFGADGYFYKLLDTSNRAGYILFCIGMGCAAILFFIAFVWMKLNAWHLWSLFIVFALAASLLAVLAPQIGSPLPYHLFTGLGILGWPLSLYMLACAQRRFASYRLLKRSTLIFILISPITTMSDDVVASYFPNALPVVALIYVLAATALFLLTIPFTYRHLFSCVWIRELSDADMAQLHEKVEETDRFGAYNLTPREREIAVLLLAAKTRRQIDGELSLTESTVKTHTSNLYKKLNINSRVELFRIFGVPKGRSFEE